MKKYLFSIIFSIIMLVSIAKANEYITFNKANFQLLNKLTGKYETATLQANRSFEFDKRLKVILKKCYRTAQEDEVEHIAFIEVYKTTKDDNNIEVENNIFSGWLYSSSPSLSFVQDKVYDITVLKCISE